jgi:hypothetical protein
LNFRYPIRVGLIIFVLLLTPSGEGFSRGIERTQVQNEVYLPIILNSLVNNLPPTKTPRPTKTRTPTQTRTPTRTRIPFRSSTPRPTPTQTPTLTSTSTVTHTPTYTSTITLIPFPEITIQYPSGTPSVTPSPTRSPTITPSLTPQSGYFPDTPPITWIILISLIMLWIVLAAWVIYSMRKRN